MKKLILPLLSLLVLNVFNNDLHSKSNKDLETLGDFKMKLELRPRYEYVNIDKNSKDYSDAITNRTKLSLESNRMFEVEWLNSEIELISVNNFSYDNYNPSLINSNNKNFIGEPQQARLNKIYLDFVLSPNTLIKAGRFGISFDDEKFIGTNEWYQMTSSLDSLYLSYSPGIGSEFHIGYIFGINTSLEQKNSHSTNSIITNGTYSLSNLIKLNGYAYLLSSLSDTYGGKLFGTYKSSKKMSIDYKLEYAYQGTSSLSNFEETNKNFINKSDTNPILNTQFYRAGLDINYVNIFFGTNYEVMDGTKSDDSTNGFTTPLSSFNKFNGFSDIFRKQLSGYGDNSNGLSDFNFNMGFNNKYGYFNFIYHKFDAMKLGKYNSTNLGQEFDIVYKKKIPFIKNISILLKGSVYKYGSKESSQINDQNNIWLQLNYNLFM